MHHVALFSLKHAGGLHTISLLVEKKRYTTHSE
jgi:hypothetical protein